MKRIKMIFPDGKEIFVEWKEGSTVGSLINNNSAGGHRYRTEVYGYCVDGNQANWSTTVGDKNFEVSIATIVPRGTKIAQHPHDGFPGFCDHNCPRFVPVAH